MIVVTKNNEFIITRSDSGKYIMKVGTDEVYSEAVDVLDYTYEETDKDIESPTEENTGDSEDNSK